MADTLFIADLHLDPARPSATAALTELLRREARRLDALYILGDLFEMWIGDDDDDPFAQRCVDALHCAAQVTRVYVMHGNRDFLLAESFAARTGATLISDPHLTTLYGRATLLMHGDSLCTHDHAYQSVRAVLRSADWQQEIARKPLAERRLLGAHMRAQSRANNANQPQQIMDVADESVLRALDEHKVDLLIHGHTHRPALHKIVRTDGAIAGRIVLGQWDHVGWLLRANEQRLDLERFVINGA